MKSTILPGVHVWGVFQPDRNIDFNGVFWERPSGGVLIDPMPLSAADAAFLRERGGARHILLTNADHVRATAACKDAFQAKVFAPVRDRARFGGESTGLVDAWYETRDDLPEDLRDDVHVFLLRGGKSAVEAALYLAPIQTIYFSDAVRSHTSGKLTLLPDEKLQDKTALLDSIRRVLPLPFDAVLLGDGDPILRGGKEALYECLETLPGVLFNRINTDRPGGVEFVMRSKEPRAQAARAQLSRFMTCRKLGFSMTRVEPGSVTTAYHYETGDEEEIFWVRKGKLIARTPQGEFELVEGDLVAFPANAAGAHQFRNDGDVPCEFFALGVNDPKNYCMYPETQKILVGARGEMYRIADRRTDYWEGDTTVGRPPLPDAPSKEAAR